MNPSIHQSNNPDSIHQCIEPSIAQSSDGADGRARGAQKSSKMKAQRVIGALHGGLELEESQLVKESAEPSSLEPTRLAFKHV